MTQRVHAKQVKVVLGPHDAHFHVADHRRLRSSVELIHAAIFKAGASGVKVHRSGGDTGPEQCCFRRPILIGPHIEIDVSVRTEAGLGVVASGRPALGQERLYTARSQERQGVFDLFHM